MSATAGDPSRPGAVAAKQPGAAPLTVFAAPATGDEFNTLGERLVPKGCFKIEDLLFDFDSSFVRPDIAVHLPQLVQLRNDNKVPDPKSGADILPPLSIFGHADPVGNDDFNKRLSGRRATAIYAMLVRDVDLWESMFTNKVGGDDWGTRAVQTMLSRVQAPIGIDGKTGDETRTAIRSFQNEQGLNVDGNAGPSTRKVLYRAYMDALCGPNLQLDKTKDFLARNRDGSGGKGDFQGCSEFNPLLLFSKAEAAEFERATDKTERNQENAPNRRVMILLFAPGRRVNPTVWPCPRASEGVAACKKRFFPDAEVRRSFQAGRRAFEDTKDTFACRFYQIISDDSPCERVKPAPLPPIPPPPPPVTDEIGPFIDEVREPASQSPLSLVGNQSQVREDSRSILSLLATPSTAAAVSDTPSISGPGFGFVMVRKDTSVPRQAFRLRVDKAFDGKGTLTVVPAGKINFFKPGGGGKTPMSFVGDNVFDGADLSKKDGVVLFAEGVTASLNKDDITLILTLSGGSKKVKPPATMKLTSVELTLDIAPPPASKQQPQPLPVPDKRTKGVTVSAQDDPPHARRAVLIVRPPKPPNLNHDLLLHTLSGRVDAFDEQVPAKEQKPKSGVIEIKSNSIPGTGLQFFVQGKFPSNKQADETYSLGINTGALGTLQADTVALTVVPQLIVHLKLAFLDPTNPAQEHVFPEGFPVTVEEATAPDQKVGKNGTLTFAIERQLQPTFTLKFSSSDDVYIATAPTGAAAGTDTEKLASAAAVPALVQKGHRVFMLPRKWSLIESDWTPDDTLHFDAPNASFKDVQNPSVTFGTEAKPIKLTLNPHWQYLRFEYFDRFFGLSAHGNKRIGIPPIMVEGFRQAPTGKGAAPADTRSNWTVNGNDPSKSCQCLPWVVQRKPDKTADAKPDTKVLVQFRSTAGTFVKATNATTRSIVTTGAALAGTDPGLNAGAAASDNPNTANVARLKLYDLPVLWKSQRYFARLAGGGDTFFESLTLAQLQASANKDPSKMLTFSLDDIVVTDDRLAPIPLAAASGAPGTAAFKPAEHAAIFSHLFSTDPNDAKVSSLGIFDADINEPYFSKDANLLSTTRNYIAQYPSWTRLVIAKGSVLDVFDQRTADGANRTVGARAAVRWVNSPAIGIPGAQIKLQKAKLHPFCIVHPFYNQAHFAQFSGSPVQTDNVGRFDLVLLRCCGVESDGTTESALAMSYIRFAFNFRPKPNPKPGNPAIGPDNPPEFDAAAVPLALTGAPAAAWITTALQSIPKRWTGPDGTHNPTVAAIVSRAPAGANALRAKCMMFGQSLPRSQAHFELGIFRNNPPAGGGTAPAVRAYMGSNTGYGTLDQNDNLATAFFTAAHESGHGISLNDEYLEQIHSPGTPPPIGQYPTPWVLGFDSNEPGGPYQPDEVNAAVPGQAGMMNANDEVRGRYFWHIAEWMRVNLGTPFDVSHNSLIYTLPPITQSTIGLKSPTADRFNLVGWPLRQTYGVSRPQHVRHDVFLYPLGHDAYADTRLPAAAKLVASPPPATVSPYDGIMITVVRLAFSFPPGTTNAQIHTWLQSVDAGILSTYCFRFRAAGAAGTALSRVLLHFSARYRAPRYSPNPQTAGITPHITVSVVNTGAPGWTANTIFRTNRTAAGATALVNAFADMIGLSGLSNTAASYTTLASEVLGAPTVSAAST